MKIPPPHNLAGQIICYTFAASYFIHRNILLNLHALEREEALPLGFIILLLCIVCGAVAVAIGIYVLKQRRLQRLKDPRKDYYR